MKLTPRKVNEAGVKISVVPQNVAPNLKDGDNAEDCRSCARWLGSCLVDQKQRSMGLWVHVSVHILQ